MHFFGEELYRERKAELIAQIAADRSQFARLRDNPPAASQTGSAHSIINYAGTALRTWAKLRPALLIATKCSSALGKKRTIALVLGSLAAWKIFGDD